MLWSITQIKMTLLDNPKRQKIMIKKMKDDIKQVKKIYKDKKIMETLTEEQKEKSWQNTFNEDRIYEQLAIFENNNEYLATNAVYLATMVQYKYTYLKWITVMPNIDWYFKKEGKKEGYDDIIKCIFPKCPHKDKPICFMSWIPSNRPEVKHKYVNVLNKDYFSDRAYIMAICDLHYHKWVKNDKYVMDFMLDNILPLRKYENKDGYIEIPNPPPKDRPMTEEEAEHYSKIMNIIS